MSAENFIVSLYTEMTPNPESLKFVLNKMLLAGNSADYKAGDDVSGSPLANALFERYSFVRGVFIMNNFVTISKDNTLDWFDVKREISDFIKHYVSDGNDIVNELPHAPQMPEQQAGQSSGEEEGVVDRIRQMLDQYVKPAVEMDGGAINFKDFNDGVVTVMLQGSCSGCPSSTVTLKAGIEGLLKRMIPEVTEVVAESI